MFWLGLRPGDVHLNISSAGWAKHAWSCLFAPWNAGACVFIHNMPRFTATALLETLARCQVTSLCAPPTVWRMLIQEDLAGWKPRLALRSTVGAGEPLNPEIIEQVRKAWGLQLRDGYGQTETTAMVGNSPGLPVKPGSMGRPLPGYRIVLIDVDGREADEGEVCIDLRERPVGLMVGYVDSPEKTADVMRDGVYRTGDTASRDGDGYLTFVGRADDVFKASDYRISPFELESVLIEHEAVAEVAIVPSPDPVRLAVPKAYVMLAPGRTPDAALAEEILAFARRQLAPYKRYRVRDGVAQDDLRQDPPRAAARAGGQPRGGRTTRRVGASRGRLPQAAAGNLSSQPWVADGGCAWRPRGLVGCVDANLAQLVCEPIRPDCNF
jgi:acetyl-CoA synthetase